MRTLKVVCSLFLLTACARPYNMELQAAPNPFTRPGCRAIVEPIHTERMLVGSMPEPMYIAQKKDSSADSYMVDKQESDGLFHQQIIDEHGALFAPGNSPDNTFIIRPSWTHWEPGTVVGFGPHPSVADFFVEVLTQNGQVLDRFDFQTQVNASMFNPSSGGRMRSALKKAGTVVSRYINDNWACAAH